MSSSKKHTRQLHISKQYSQMSAEELSALLEVSDDTHVVKRSKLPSKRFKSLAPAAYFTRLPRSTDLRKLSSIWWQIQMVSHQPQHLPLFLAIFSESTIGRGDDNVHPDLDLVTYDGLMMGVSRRHALFRPQEDGLYLIDLNSTNGTYVNHHQILAGKPVRLKDGDQIAFSQLEFTINLILDA